MKVYKLSKKYLRKRYIMLSIATLVILAISISPIFTEEEYPLFLILFAFVGLLVFVIVPLVHLHYDLILDDSYIHKKNLFTGYKMDVQNIKEYKFKEGKIVIISKTAAFINIEIVPGYEPNDFDEIFTWLDAKTKNIELETQIKTEIEELRTIAISQDFGVSENERFDSLEEARKKARMLNIAAIPLAAWLIFYPYPLQLVVSIAIILPLVAVYLIYRYQGLITLFEDNIKNRIYPSLLPVFALSGALVLRIVFDFQIASYTNLWFNLIMLIVVFMGITYFSTYKIHFKVLKDYPKLITPLLFFAIYSYGALMAINCYADNSSSTRYETMIVSKEEYNNKGRTKYHLTVEYWHNSKEMVGEIEVAYATFRRVKKGDIVLIDENKGRLNIPHYTIARIILQE